LNLAVRRRPLAVATLLALSACRAPESPPPVEVTSGAQAEPADVESPAESREEPGFLAVGGVYLLRGVTFLFWDVPVFVLYRVPKFVVWDAPSALVESLRSDRGRIESAIADLSKRQDLGLEEERERFTILEDATGLSFTDRAEWIRWWSENRDRPRNRWREDWIDDAFRLLESDDYWDRTVGADRLRRASRIDPGYDAKAAATERASNSAAWRRWWERERSASAR
jgi:hypothetical protein